MSARLWVRRSCSRESTFWRRLFERKGGFAPWSEFLSHLIRDEGVGTSMRSRQGKNGFGPFEGLSQKTASCGLVVPRPQRTFLYASAFSLPAALLANFLNSPYCRNKSASSRGRETPHNNYSWKKPGIRRKEQRLRETWIPD